MHHMVIICKLILFLLSSLGIWEYFRRKSKMNVYFLPAFTICLQITILFCAGILNCLKAAVFLMFATGIVLVAYYLYTDFMGTVRTYLNGGICFLAIAFFLVLVVCEGQTFTMFDDFSHWATSVKNMLMTDRYPSFQDTMILYQEYPLGSTSYVYFFSKLVSSSESVQMAAQAFMMLCFILPIFKYVQKFKLVSGVYMLLFAYYLFGYNIGITCLLVDTLLPLQGMATILFVYSECLKSHAMGIEEESVCPFYAVPFLCTAVQIKNSGIYFVVLACLLLLGSLKHDKDQRKQKIITIGAPFLSMYLWQAHCSYVFSDGLVTKHAMTLQNYQTEFNQKSGGDIRGVLCDILRFSISGRGLYYLLLFAAVVGLLSFLADVSVRKKYVKMLFLCVAMYIVYMAGMAFMYVFSMPEKEAAVLAGSDRYRGTIFVAIYYFLMVFLFKILDSINVRKKEWYCLSGMFLILLFSFSVSLPGRFSVLFNRGEIFEPKYLVEQAIKDGQVPVGASCMVCTPLNRKDYMRHMVRYRLWSDSVSSRVITKKSKLDKAKNYEYILICDPENEIIEEWVRENYPEQEGRLAIKLKQEKKR